MNTRSPCVIRINHERLCAIIQNDPISLILRCGLALAVLVWVFVSAVPVLASTDDGLTIAAILPLTGKARGYGEPALAGAHLAIDEINATGGVLGQPLSLVILDNKSGPIYARQAARKAIAKGVSGVIGAIWSTHSLAIAPALQNAQIPMISPGSTAPAVTQTGDYVFRICYTDDFQGLALARFARIQLKARRAAVLVNISETYSRKLAERFNHVFHRLGGSVVFIGHYKGTAVDFIDILNPLRTMAPDVVFVPGYSQDSGLVIRQAVSLGIHSIYMGGDAWEKIIADVAGPAIEGSLFSTFWHPEVPNAISRDFVSRYRAVHGNNTISPYTALTYDAVRLMADAMQRAGSGGGQAVRSALAATRGFPATTGKITFGPQGDPVGVSISLLQYMDTDWQFLTTIDNP